jgi:hypothetical protein
VRERAGTAIKSLLAGLRGKAAAEQEEINLVDASLPFSDPVDHLLPERLPGLGDIHLDRALVMASSDMAHRLGANFLLYDIPVAGDRVRLTSSLSMIGPLPGVATASPMPDFEAVASPSVKLYYEQGHHHWTPLGNALAAKAAARAIAEQKLLIGCTVLPAPLPAVR